MYENICISAYIRIHHYIYIQQSENTAKRKTKKGSQTSDLASKTVGYIHLYYIYMYPITEMQLNFTDDMGLKIIDNDINSKYT